MTGQEAQANTPGRGADSAALIYLPAVSYYFVVRLAGRGVDWSYRTDYVRERHGIEVEWANEAPEDPDTLRIEPDRDAR